METSPRILRLIYGITLFFITLTGFAQMPIFKRYYIADIPGLGWLDRFYVTHAMHYMAASVLIFLAAYVVINYLFNRKSFGRVTAMGGGKALLLLGLILSGAFMVVRNLPGVYFSHMSIIAVNMIHTGLCMALLMVTLYGVAGKKAWTSRE